MRLMNGKRGVDGRGARSNAQREHQEVESVGGDLTWEMCSDLGALIAEKRLVENDKECCLLKDPPKKINYEADTQVVF